MNIERFDNVTVMKKANVFFDGKVVSRTVLFADGSKKTLGFMQPGEYEFNTVDAEIMEILSGELTVLLPGQSTPQAITGGQSFNVPANARFVMQVSSVTDYCCSFIKA